MRNFKVIDADIDIKNYERTFSGKLTKKRYKALDRWCRYNSKHIGNCGHEYDCCGCLSSTWASFTYSKNQVTVSYSLSFNY